LFTELNENRVAPGLPRYSASTGPCFLQRPIRQVYSGRTGFAADYLTFKFSGYEHYSN